MNNKGFLVWDKPSNRVLSPQQMVNLLIKNEANKSKLIKQLEQLEIDINGLDDLTISQIYKRYESILKNTYSIKYLGLNENQIGMISKRINPSKSVFFDLSQFSNSTYTVNKYFYPKPLKIPKKSNNQEKLNIYNLQETIKKDFTNNKNKTSYGNRNQQNNIMKKTLSGSWISKSNNKPFSKNGKRTEIEGTIKNTLNNITDYEKTYEKYHSYSRNLQKGLIKNRM